MKHVIVVCGTFHEWIDFKDWFHNENKITSFKGNYISNNSFTVSDLITYHYMIADDYNKIMGFSKHETEVIRIGTWYENITEDAERYLALFRW